MKQKKPGAFKWVLLGFLISAVLFNHPLTKDFCEKHFLPAEPYKFPAYSHTSAALGAEYVQEALSKLQPKQTLGNLNQDPLQNTQLLGIEETLSELVFSTFFFLVLVALFASFSQPFLGATGACNVLLIALFTFWAALVACLPSLTSKDVVLNLELDVYFLYSPTAAIAVALEFDKISIAFTFLVTAITCAALTYSKVYLSSDPHLSDFAVKLTWFAISMITLVLSRNVIMMYFCWEFIGITSAWLINFNSQRVDTVKSALKAFTFNKVSDLAFFSALLIGYVSTNSTNVNTWPTQLSAQLATGNVLWTNIHWMGALLCVAAAIKSAQVPFHIWLPDSMDAPVPASALIHSATLVSAGVYLLLRFDSIVHLAGMQPAVAFFGAATAAYGGVVAAMQTDLKRALAYSTISHCGFLAVSTTTGCLNVTLLYLFLHGFFKALSFICAGEMIKTGAGYQDINRMGSFFFYSPLVVSQLFIAMSNLCGLPLFFGASYKTSLQFLEFTNSLYGAVFKSFLFIGFFSSLIYFVKVFWTTAFSFKKHAYKSKNDFFQKRSNNTTSMIYSPKILIFLFWFMYSMSCFAVFILLDANPEAWPISTAEVILNSLSFVESEKIKTTGPVLNYFFLFYSLFLFVVYSLCVTNSANAQAPSALLSKLTCLVLTACCLFLCF